MKAPRGTTVMEIRHAEGGIDGRGLTKMFGGIPVGRETRE